MQVRPTQTTAFHQVERGLMLNLARLALAQRQVASGLRIERPSDDPHGAARALAYARQLAGTERYSAAAETGRARLDLAATRLEDSSDILIEARALLVQGMNGTLSEGDRSVLAEQVRILRDRLLESANAGGPEGALFNGTAGGEGPAFVSGDVHGRARVSYAGDGQSPEVLVGVDLALAVGVPGSEVFARVQREGTLYGGFTGAAVGTGGDAGTGAVYLTLRHDGTSGTLSGGAAFVSSGASDTLLGAHALEVDGTARTLQLSGGALVTLPPPGDPGLADVTVVGENGAELHLDLSGWDGSSFSASVEGAGSAALDGSTWTALDFGSSDVALFDGALGVKLSVDARGIRRAGSELVLFGGAVNAFDALEGIADDLENVDELPLDALQERLGLWLTELDRNQGNVVSGLGVLGGRSARLDGVLERLGDEATDLTSRRSALVDTDYSLAALEMARAEQTLQLAQASGARLLSTSLLDFLR
jgi:flagellin-like hook-associated protein FlgL